MYKSYFINNICVNLVGLIGVCLTYFLPKKSPNFIFFSVFYLAC